ncbi:MAG: hypothetical protein ACO1OC_05280 [Tuberibacillus sp.]
MLTGKLARPRAGLYLEGTVQRTREIADAVITSGHMCLNKASLKKF